ncbi:MAG: rod shape-determining protein [Patescibacteria group bacterium]|nr:rod shape-determining protein [Patescibacteria group bacterium]MDE2437892.1 rod shape-determining protein [Patescibacteria group bacterium]
MISRIGIDLGTANTLVFVPKKGVVMNEPSIVALDNKTRAVLAVGKEAKEMLGRTPEDIGAYRPLKDGVIADYYITKSMLKYFITKATGFSFFKPEVVISVPAGITSTERRAVISAAEEAGAKTAYVVKEPILAALGAGIPINSPSGNMIVNIGGGTTEVAVISLGGIVASRSLRIAGNKCDQAIAEYVKKKYSLAIGEQTAEGIKIEIGSALPMKAKLEMQVRGRDLVSGFPQVITMNSNEVASAISDLLLDVIRTVKDVFNETPPELAADVMDKGIVVSGGGALLRNIDEYIKKMTGVSAFCVDNSLFSVVNGAGMVINHLDTYQRALVTKRFHA